MPNVFISYRRSDSAGYAGWIYDRLVESFGADSVFIDIDSLPLGMDFVPQLEQSLARTEVALVLIGPGWLDAADERGNRRLDDPHDFVRLEVATVLKADMRVIPVLLDGARMPKATALPDELHPLAHRQAFVFDRRGGRALRDLIGALQRPEPSPAPASRQEEVAPARRKVVTALVCDVTGSTFGGDELDPEVLGEVMSRYFSAVRAIIEQHGGAVERFTGDAVMGVFGIPVAYEDDALRAIKAAAEIRERLPTIAEESAVQLQFRIGVNTGLVLIEEGENLAVGDAVNMAARLEQAAEPGEIVLGEETLSLVRGAVEVEALTPLQVKDKSTPVSVARLLSVDRVARSFVPHLDVPLVGRQRELELLRRAWEQAVNETGCYLFTALGEAGVGKSRLVSEFLASLGDRSTVLRGRCLHYGEGITFWPLVEALSSVAEAQPVLERVSTGGASSPGELFWEIRRLLETLAAQQPLVLHVDDLQWAEPMLLDLLDYLSELSRGAPILILCTARPELLEDRPEWAVGKRSAETLLLKPLTDGEAEALLDQVANGLDRESRMRVISAGEGNPLFLEEMVALAKERGTIETPPTIQALLTARLERLTSEERGLLERGAVEGEVFHRLAVLALAANASTGDMELRLAGLVRKDLIRPHRATIKDDEAFRFRHLLIRDAAYDSLPKAVRAELHVRFARWLESTASELAELDEIAGWHLEQTVRYVRELGRQADPEIALSAAEHLYEAGRRAGMRADVSAARNLLERALALAPEHHAAEAKIAVELAQELLLTGELARADQLLTRAERDPVVGALASAARLAWLFEARPEEAASSIDAKLGGLLEQLTAARDEQGLARAHMLAGYRQLLANRNASAGQELQLAAGHARKAGDEGLRSRALSGYITSLIYGPVPAGEMAIELDRVERDGRGPRVQAAVEIGRSKLALLEGRFTEAREWAERAVETFTAIGGRTSWAWECAADAQAGAGEVRAAVEALERADAIDAESGGEAFRSTLQARLAELYLALGELDAARTAIELSEKLTAPEDVQNYAITHRVRAELALKAGDLGEAERWARSAVEKAQLTDDTSIQAAATLALARILATLPQREEAEVQARAALDLYESKGDRPGTAETRGFLNGLDDSGTAG